MLTHAALPANLEQVSARQDPPAMTEDDVVLCVLPLSHVYSLNGTLGLVARPAATMVLTERFDPAAALARHR